MTGWRARYDLGKTARRSRSGVWRSLGIWAFSVAVVLLREPHVILRPQFIWEEAGQFWAPTFTIDPMHYLVEPWAGYLQVPSRAAFLLARLGPFEVAPAVTILIHAAIIGLVAVFLASDRLADAIPDRRVRLGLALALPLLPATETFITVLSAQWFLAVFVVALSLTTDRRWWDYPALAIAGLSGVAVTLALPLYWRDRRGLVLLACAVIQGLTLLASDRRPNAPGVNARDLAILGSLAVAVILLRQLPLRTRASFIYLGVLTVLLGMLVLGGSSGGGRTFLAISACLVLLALGGLFAVRPAGLALASVMVVAIIANFAIQGLPDTDWPQHAHCIGGPVPCVVPVEPSGYIPSYSVVWPGR
jgi:hypothetical protein